MLDVAHSLPGLAQECFVQTEMIPYRRVREIKNFGCIDVVAGKRTRSWKVLLVLGDGSGVGIRQIERGLSRFVPATAGPGCTGPGKWIE